MDLVTYHNLKPGDMVRHTKSGNTYMVCSAKRRKVLSNYIEEEIKRCDASLAWWRGPESNKAWPGIPEKIQKLEKELADLFIKAQRGYDIIIFQQIRANKKGVVGEYGPATELKPNMIEMM